MKSLVGCREGEVWDVQKASIIMSAWSRSEAWCKEEIRRSDRSEQAEGSVEDKLSCTDEAADRGKEEDAIKGDPTSRNPLRDCARREGGEVVVPLRKIMPLGGSLMPLTYAGTDVCGIAQTEWTCIDVIVDSGACETVMPRSMCSHISILPSAQSRAGVEYEVASGLCIPNLGERHCEVYTEHGASALLMHFQVADVHKPLLSLSKAADMGFTSHLQSDGGYIEDSQTGEKIPIQRRGNLYMLQLWVRGVQGDSGSGFAGPR